MRTGGQWPRRSTSWNARSPRIVASTRRSTRSSSPGCHRGPILRLISRRSRRLLVQVLEKPMGCELDLLVAPLRCTEMAGDDSRPMDAPEITEDEGIAGLGLVRGAIGQAHVPRCV